MRDGRADVNCSSKASKLLGFGLQSCQEQIVPKKIGSDEIQKYVEGSKASRLLGLDGPQSVSELPLKSPKLLSRSTSGKPTKGNDSGKMNRSLNVVRSSDLHFVSDDSSFDSASLAYPSVERRLLFLNYKHSKHQRLSIHSMASPPSIIWRTLVQLILPLKE